MIARSKYRAGRTRSITALRRFHSALRGETPAVRRCPRAAAMPQAITHASRCAALLVTATQVQGTPQVIGGEGRRAFVPRVVRTHALALGEVAAPRRSSKRRRSVSSLAHSNPVQPSPRYSRNKTRNHITRIKHQQQHLDTDTKKRAIALFSCVLRHESSSVSSCLALPIAIRPRSQTRSIS